MAKVQLACLLALSVAACEGDTGPAGPAGPQGADGDAGATVFSGTLDLSQDQAAEVPVVLHVLDGNGKSVGTPATSLTDTEGRFQFTLFDIDAPGTHLLLEAAGHSRSWFAVAAEADQTIDVAADGVWRIVKQIVESEGGRSVGDYTPSEIQSAVAGASAALVTAEVDLADPEAVVSTILSTEGGAIADFSGGMVDATVAEISITTPADIAFPVSGYSVDLFDVDGQRWDLDFNGEVWDGTSDAYDGAFRLSVDGYSLYPWQVDQGDVFLEDGRELAVGPAVNFEGLGLDVSRKVYVPQAHAFARFLEILHNPTSEAISATVQIRSNLGSDEFDDAVMFSSSGDTTVDESDVWLANHMDTRDPAVGFFFAGATAEKISDTIYYSWQDVTVPPGETVILMHFGFQRSGTPVSELAATLSRLELEGLQAEYLKGMTTDEYAALLHAPHPPNVIGEAGAAAPGEGLTLTNTNSGESTTVVASSDGSFIAFLAVSVGDIVQLDGDMGTDETVTAM